MITEHITKHMTKAELHALDKKLAITAERVHIADGMKAIALDLLRDKESDAIDGYVAAVIIDLAEVIKSGGSYERHKV
jgi:hypothetical protein